MRNGVYMLVLASLASGCGGPGGGLFGIWAFTLEPIDYDDPTSNAVHNYVGVAEGGDIDVGPWTYTNTADQSASIVMAEIFGLNGKGESEVVMVIGGNIYPGNETEKNTWVFEWHHSSDDNTNMQHTDGYMFNLDESEAFTTTLEILFDGSSATGTIDYDYSYVADYRESERWETTNGILNTLVPADFYIDAGDNEPTTDECLADPCTLMYSSGATSSTEFTGAWTRYKDEGAFDSIDMAGQPFGTGNFP